MLEPVNPTTQRGPTLVELLIGLALGLLVVGGSAMPLANHLREPSALPLEARLMQDLRTEAGLVSRFPQRRLLGRRGRRRVVTRYGLQAATASTAR